MGVRAQGLAPSNASRRSVNTRYALDKCSLNNYNLIARAPRWHTVKGARTPWGGESGDVRLRPPRKNKAGT